MKLCSYPLNGELFEQQDPSAKIDAEKEFSNEGDYLHTFRGRILFLSAVDEWVPRNPDSQGPSKEGNISGEIRRVMNCGDNGRSEMTTDLYSAPSQSM